MNRRSFKKKILFFLFFNVYLFASLPYVTKGDSLSSIPHFICGKNCWDLAKVFSSKNSIKGDQKIMIDFSTFFFSIFYFLILILFSRASVYFLYSLRSLEKNILDGNEEPQPDSVIDVLRSKDIQKK